MSKASEWAKRGRVMKFRERLSAGDKRHKMTPFVAHVNLRGELVLDEYEAESIYRLRGEEATRFARWILGVFSEPEGRGPR